MRNGFTRLVFVVTVLMSASVSLAAIAVDARASGSAKALLARHAQLTAQLNRNAFGLPLYLESAETPGTLAGDVYARVDYPFATVQAALTNPAHWCDILTLHPNTKFCTASGKGNDTRLAVNVGTKREQKLEDTFRIEFAYLVASRPQESWFQTQLRAEEGPLSTRDYRISLEAVALGNRQTFVHLRYSYAYGMAGRLALKAYLATIGSDKVGFTVVGKKKNGKAEYIGGVRGVVERNTMRYYLGIDSYLAAVSVLPVLQRENRLQHWFTATERYATQLHEMDRETYIRMKHAEYVRQQAGPE